MKSEDVVCGQAAAANSTNSTGKNLKQRIGESLKESRIFTRSGDLVIAVIEKSKTSTAEQRTDAFDFPITRSRAITRSPDQVAAECYRTLRRAPTPITVRQPVGSSLQSRPRRSRSLPFHSPS